MAKGEAMTTTKRKPTTLAAAVREWAAMPASARHDAIAFFRAEAQQSVDWASAEYGAVKGRHMRDVAALRAAVELLRAAQRRPKVRR